MKKRVFGRYEFIADAYRNHFRSAVLEMDQSPDQFILRLSSYLYRWTVLADTEDDVDGVKQIFLWKK